MSKHNRKNFSEDQIKYAILTGKTMGGAAKVLGIDSRTFKRNAEVFGLYDGAENKGGTKFELQDILDGKHPQYPTSKLSKRLVKDGLKKYECESCGISDWNGKPISLELNHKDGNNANHSLDNLEILCPNCHSQTDTYRSKNILKKKGLGT
jgi:5-methylcytosine-specific restriction endonuclease McrA